MHIKLLSFAAATEALALNKLSPFSDGVEFLICFVSSSG